MAEIVAEDHIESNECKLKAVQIKDCHEDHGWQLDKNIWSEQTLYLLDKSKWSDCIFVAGHDLNSSKRFNCHKILMAKSSPVFEKMLFGHMSEKEISVTEKPEVFEALLHYLYTGNVDTKDYTVVLGMCMAADKYILNDLKFRCHEYLFKNLEPSNSCGAYELAKMLDFKDFRRQAWKVIVERTDEVVEADTIKEVSRDSLLCIVQMNLLHIPNEIPLITACNRWAEHRVHLGEVEANTEGLRKALGPIFQHLRFLTITAEQFAEGPSKLRILSAEEKVALYSVLIRKNFDLLPNGFSTMAIKRKYLQLAYPQFTFSREVNNYYSTSNVNTSNGNNNTNNNKLCYKCKGPKNPPPCGIVASINFHVDCDIRVVGLAFPKESDLTTPDITIHCPKGEAKGTGTHQVAITNAIIILFQHSILVLKGQKCYITVTSDTGECKITNFKSSYGQNMFLDRSLAANPNTSCIVGVFYKRA